MSVGVNMCIWLMKSIGVRYLRSYEEVKVGFKEEDRWQQREVNGFLV